MKSKEVFTIIKRKHKTCEERLLEAEVYCSAMDDSFMDMELRAVKAEAENDLLRAVLEPFAAMYNVFPERWRNGELPVGSIYGFEDAEITFADLKRAADALEGGAE